jgi:2-dehydropantoate 2-reductase
MSADNARILVIGAGVNGSICGLGLFNAGFDVTVLARGKRHEELRKQGIIIEDPFMKTHRAQKYPSSTHMIRKPLRIYPGHLSEGPGDGHSPSIGYKLFPEHRFHGQ